MNFLGVGGFSPVQSASLNTLAAIQEAWPTSGSQHVLICSSDEKYQSDLVGVATTLKKLGAKSLWLAGPPPGEEQILRDWKQAGLDGYVFRGCDVLQTLRELGLAMGRSL